MYKIKAQPVGRMDFSDLGTCYNMLDPGGFHMGSLYPDKILLPLSGVMPLAFSAYLAEQADEMLVPGADYSSWAPFAMMPLDGDMIWCAAPASTQPRPELMRAFLVPRGTMVSLNAGVWRHAPFAAGAEPVHTLICVPQRTYQNDTTHAEYPVGDWVRIERP